MKTKTKYTKEQIKECIRYLDFCIKEGCIDSMEAIELINKRQWKEIYDMMDRADAYANDYENYQKEN